MTDLTIPFGKHKGRTVEAVAIADLLQGGDRDDTPEHNQMQARFLATAHCLALVNARLPDWRVRFHPSYRCSLLDEADRRYTPAILARRDIRRFLDSAKAVPRVTSSDPEARAMLGRGRKWYQERFADHRRARTARDALMDTIRHLPATTELFVAEAKFEGITDVLIEARLSTRFAGDKDPYTERLTLMVELKPDLGDDYPKVLRQMHAQQQRAAGQYHGGSSGVWSLVVRRFGTTLVGLDQVREIFLRSGITLLLETEIT